MIHAVNGALCGQTYRTPFSSRTCTQKHTHIRHITFVVCFLWFFFQVNCFQWDVLFRANFRSLILLVFMWLCHSLRHCCTFASSMSSVCLEYVECVRCVASVSVVFSSLFQLTCRIWSIAMKCWLTAAKKKVFELCCCALSAIQPNEYGNGL